MPTTKTPRGIRLNNPGNVERTGQRWQGLHAVQSDPRFFRFIAPFWGLRCAGRILLTYQRQYGLRTPRALISRWAPPEENETSFYIVHVAKGSGVGIDTTVDFERDVPVLCAFVTTIVKHENGQQPYSAELIRSACLSALGRKA